MRHRLLPILLIITGFFIIIMAYLMLVSHNGNEGTVELPEILGNLSRSIDMYGEAAVADVNRLHGKDFNIASGAKGIYGLHGEAILWVTAAKSELDASGLLIAMHDAIAEGNSPYMQVGIQQINGEIIYELDGLGQKNYYYQSGELVIWLAVDHELAEDLLNEILTYYR
jgi:hypothetical protein